MKTFQEFMVLCESENSFAKRAGWGGGASITLTGDGGRIRPKRKKTTPEIRRTRAVGGGRTEPVTYKPRKDIGTQRASSERQQQPTQERGSADVRARAAAAAKEERKKAALARIAAKKKGETVSASKPKAKEVEKTATKLLSTKKPEAPKPAAEKTPRRKWEHPGGGAMTRAERDKARNAEKTAKAQKTKKSATEILAQMRREYEEGGGKWSNAVAVRMRAKAKAAAS